MKESQFVTRRWVFPEVRVPSHVTEVRIHSNENCIELVGIQTTTRLTNLHGLEDLGHAILAAMEQLQTWKLIKHVYPEEADDPEG